MSPPEQRDSPHALVLAAGAGARFAGGKMLAPFRGQPLVASAVRAALATKALSVTVVLGADASELEHALDEQREARLRLVRNADWQSGLSSSLRCGLACLPSDASAVLVFLGDMPNVSAELGDRALACVAAGAAAAFPVFAGMPGHPVAIARTLFPALNDLAGDQGARAVLAGMAGVERIETDDAGCIQDIDTQDDLDGLA